ncbi:hypothetical protein [Portibacter lacus]|uniref:Uncharacterized protein n=1 Tax=Portibacter lacus TaxID=1099794 RepID=A0AA37WD93_9BACT|nr:hypothetical protein [Portibacter lacus]GLR17711.1 hypothetical protein GCM10007940_23260 [Portibacter lacus]
MTYLALFIGLVIGFLIAAYLFQKSKTPNHLMNNDLTPEEIEKIMKGLTDENSEYYIYKPGTKLKRRFESIMDFVLSDLNSETKKIILDDPINFNTAIALIAMGETDRNPDFKPSPEWIEKQRSRIQKEESYTFPELGAKKCPPPEGGGHEAFDIERMEAPWWTWFLNKYINVLHNYDTDIIGELNNNRLIKPSIKNRFFTQFEKPSDIGDDGAQFALIIKLTNTKTKEEILIKYYLAFKD